jgi:aminoglycoside phosphotransferase (APT) family kinase protein
MNTPLLDHAKHVRQGEEFDTQKVNTWLKQHIADLTGTPRVTQYPGGASNWTYCLEYPEQALILRRAPKGTKAKGAHNMGREFKLQQALKPVYSYVPKMAAFCDHEHILGTDFYVMEKLTGIIARKNLPRGLITTPEQTKQLCENVLDCL